MSNNIKVTVNSMVVNLVKDLSFTKIPSISSRMSTSKKKYLFYFILIINIFILTLIENSAFCMIFKPKCQLSNDKSWKIALGINGKIFVITEKGNYTLFLEDKHYTLNYPAFSENTHLFGYCQYGNNYYSIVVKNFANGEKQELVKSKKEIKFLLWSPDGKKLLFLTDYNYDKESMDLCIVDIYSKKIEIIVDDAVNAVSVCPPSWNNNKIIFSRIDGKIAEIDLNNNNKIQPLFDGVSASFSPSGKYIVYRKGKNTYEKLNSGVKYSTTGFKYYLYDVENKKETFLFNGQSIFGLGAKVWQAPVWSPDSNYIMFFRTYDIPSSEDINLINIKNKEICLFAKGMPHSPGAVSWVPQGKGDFKAIESKRIF